MDLSFDNINNIITIKRRNKQRTLK